VDDVGKWKRSCAERKSGLVTVQGFVYTKAAHSLVKILSHEERAFPKFERFVSMPIQMSEFIEGHSLESKASRVKFDSFSSV